MLTVLLVDDDTEFTDVVTTIIEFLGFEVLTASNLADARQWLQQERIDHVLLDFMLPDGSGVHLIDDISNLSYSPKITLITGHPSVKQVVNELAGPNVDYLIKPINREEIERVLSGKSVVKSAPKQRSKVTRHMGGLIGESDVMHELYLMIERVSQTPANVMLMGESGVGKEVVARAIHLASGCQGEYVATNCGALSKELLGSELFGHEKGAFTGAVNKKTGVFEQAQDGTLFLDEITEMPIDMQPSLLRVLENQTVVRLGGTKELPVNCRVISATNRDVNSIASSKVMREDIYFRLAVFPISIPPLRERKEDIPLLAEAFIEQMNAENDTEFAWTVEQFAFLQAYDWPGNVRELRHFIHRAVIMSDPESSKIQLPQRIESPFARNVEQDNLAVVAGKTIEEVEKQLIYATLEKVDGNKTLAAQMLGISTKTLYNRLHSYGDIEPQ
ncbi:sigma-54-dependent transcriptional regulator [Alteromonas flava]|uniref:sigma-54-dependent transcriptional regulator n=1 Tax=Alteromonas flava TaxID=2048003 RepID=UPI000C281E68|nr:sigma-54 dependent transcriptional regulator [Alteromonas flava]